MRKAKTISPQKKNFAQSKALKDIVCNNHVSEKILFHCPSCGTGFCSNCIIENTGLRFQNILMFERNKLKQTRKEIASIHKKLIQLDLLRRKAENTSYIQQNKEQLNLLKGIMLSSTIGNYEVIQLKKQANYIMGQESKIWRKTVRELKNTSYAFMGFSCSISKRVKIIDSLFASNRYKMQKMLLNEILNGAREYSYPRTLMQNAETSIKKTKHFLSTIGYIEGLTSFPRLNSFLKDKEFSETQTSLLHFSGNIISKFDSINEKGFSMISKIKFKTIDFDYVIDNSSIYLSGGKNISKEKYLKSFIEIEEYSLIVKEKADLLSPKSRHSMCVYKGEFIFIIGGENDGIPLDSCERYSMKNDKWKSISHLPNAAINPAICFFQKHFIFCFWHNLKKSQTQHNLLEHLSFAQLDLRNEAGGWKSVEIRNEITHQLFQPLTCIQSSFDTIILFGRHPYKASKHMLLLFDVSTSSVDDLDVITKKWVISERKMILQNSTLFIMNQKEEILSFSLKDHSWRMIPKKIWHETSI